jgi:hypothetical protein
MLTQACAAKPLSSHSHQTQITSLRLYLQASFRFPTASHSFAVLYFCFFAVQVRI